MILAAAVHNNAAWCDAVCRSHGLAPRWEPHRWVSPVRTPPGYPDAVTLVPGVAAPDALAGLATGAGASVKDSYADLDLGPHGYDVLFEARWIGRAAHAPSPATPATWSTVDARTVGRWVRARAAGDDDPVAVLPPALLAEPGVRLVVLALDDEPFGGLVLSRSRHAPGDRDVVGVSNVRAAPGTDPGLLWRAAAAAAAALAPGVPAVGYEHGDDLVAALGAGFTDLGPLRVWMHP